MTGFWDSYFGESRLIAALTRFLWIKGDGSVFAYLGVLLLIMPGHFDFWSLEMP